jgi:hypothetical protein
MHDSDKMYQINLFHVLVTGATLVYIGNKKNDASAWAFYLIGLLACCIPLLVHTPRLELGYWPLIYIMHYFVILPSLLYIAYTQKLSDGQYNTALTTGLFVMGYHSYKAYGRLTN